MRSEGRTPEAEPVTEETGSGPRVRAAALECLRGLVGDPSARFRSGQLEAVVDLVAHRRRVLVVQRTGWGKSAVYFVATSLLRAAGAGPTLIVSPLLALMRDQVDAAARAGLRAVTLNSSNPTQWEPIVEQVRSDAVDLLLVSPERLNNPRFRAELLDDLASRTGLVVVDEAHCISDWGHDFRPDYQRIRDLLAGLRPGVPVLATTATANARVVEDVAEQLERCPHRADREVTVLRGPLARDSLRLGVLDLPDPVDRAAWLVAHLGDLPGSGIVYALTVASAQDTAALLADAGYPVRSYTGRDDPADREEAERLLRDNRVRALVATSALGMGFDKPDLGFVVHLGAPSSPVAYYQQVGRAGRATARADVLLLPGPEDRAVWDYFATATMPRPEQARAVLEALARAEGPLSATVLQTVTDVRASRLELLLKVLDVQGAVRRCTGGWRSTGVPWSFDADRYARVAAVRRAEAEAMIDYERTDACRMRTLVQALDDPAAEDCGRCDRCAGPWYARTVPSRAREAAHGQLDRVGVRIPARLRWPTGMDRLGVPVAGTVPAAERSGEGRAVTRLTGPGHGPRLRDLLAPGTADGPAPAVLLDAAVRVLAGWGWSERPVAVVAVPSRHRPELIASVARHLAQVGRLPWLGPLQLFGEGPRGGAGGNSAFRLAGLWEAFTVPEPLRVALADLDGPVLLVDDLVDSRWTLTVAGRELLLAGARQVLPFALAVAG